ncbi:MAG: winged helix-turn-helix transcriptional regulator [Candidatus Diapherotrites archaeon]|uniref:Winged helix-turn-helix transcriptional regulator n=1 Tax=Candidatus Iainarchaeum sp. TaxID=3101447 RepID=A0A8T4C6E3_9ARCH|nr:winged helix-turn-helix transcriptional regulator [Candidatus Diapherotrites archaeon]
MSDEITLDKEVFKALAGDTRVSVLKSLMERRKTQSELAKELSLAAPTIKDHLDILQKAQLVREVDDGHKWKYIELTVKGKALLQPADKRIMVLLGTSVFGIVASGFLAYSKLSVFAAQSVSNNLSTELSMKSAPFAATAMNNDALVQSAGAVSTIAPEAARVAVDATVSLPSALPVVQSFSFIPTPELAVLAICLVVFGLACGMWIKQTY